MEMSGMISEGLSRKELKILKSCMELSLTDSIFDHEGGEFQTLFGIDECEMEEVLKEYPHVDIKDYVVRAACVGALAHLMAAYGNKFKPEKELGVNWNFLSNVLNKLIKLAGE